MTNGSEALSSPSLSERSRNTTHGNAYKVPRMKQWKQTSSQRSRRQHARGCENWHNGLNTNKILYSLYPISCLDVVFIGTGRAIGWWWCGHSHGCWKEKDKVKVQIPLAGPGTELIISLQDMVGWLGLEFIIDEEDWCETYSTRDWWWEKEEIVRTSGLQIGATILVCL